MKLYSATKVIKATYYKVDICGQALRVYEIRTFADIPAWLDGTFFVVVERGTTGGQFCGEVIGVKDNGNFYVDHNHENDISIKVIRALLTIHDTLETYTEGSDLLCAGFWTDFFEVMREQANELMATAKRGITEEV